MFRSTCARIPSTRRLPRYRLSLEQLEIRDVLSAAGSTISGDSPPDTLGWVAPLTIESADDSRQPPASPDGPIRLANLQVLPSANWLVRSRRHRLEALAKTAGGESNSRNATPPVDTSLVHQVGPACDPVPLSLCKVQLDEAVDPIFNCPGLDEAYCLPSRPYRPLNPYAGAGDSRDRDPTGPRGSDPPRSPSGLPWITWGHLKQLPWAP